MRVVTGSRQILRISLTSMERDFEAGMIYLEKRLMRHIPKSSVRLNRDLTIELAVGSCVGHQFSNRGT